MAPNDFSRLSIVEIEKTKMVKTLELPIAIEGCTIDYCINDSSTMEVLPAVLTIRNKFSLQLMCKLGPSTHTYSGWIHITSGNEPRYSIYLQIHTAVAMFKQVMEGETEWAMRMIIIL